MYKIYEISDKDLIKKIIDLDPYKLLDTNNYSSLKIEVDYEEKIAFINEGELIVFIDYEKFIRYLN